MKEQKRLVLLVPTDRDMERPAYMEKYWPNFVENIRWLLRDSDCEIRVVARAEPKVAAQ